MQNETLESKKMLRGRGSAENIPNRFEAIHIGDAFDDVDNDDAHPHPKTIFYNDSSRTILTKNDSPDVGFNYGINPYRGCEHGCIYCYARPTHEYLGLSAGLDFETKIFVKERAPELLREALMKKSWIPECITLSGITDVYQPIERKLTLTRRCLEVLAEFRNPLAIITKNSLVTRDIDILSELAQHHAALVYVSVTTLDPDLCAVLEPRTARPWARLDAIRQLAEAKIPVGVSVSPVIPGLTDHEMPAILKAAAKAGATQAFYVPVRLPGSVEKLFVDWLDRHYPNAKNKILHRIQSLRKGKLNDSRFHARMEGEGVFAEQMESLFMLSCKKWDLNQTCLKLSTDSFQRPSKQLSFL